MFTLFFIIHLASPESEIISNELHDGSGIFVLIFIDVLNIGNSIIEGLLSEFTSLSRAVDDFVTENGIIEG